MVRVLPLSWRTRMAAIRERIGSGPRRGYLPHQFQTGIDLTRIGQNIIDTVRRYSIQAAAEGVELYQIQILSGFYKVCGGIERL